MEYKYITVYKEEFKLILTLSRSEKRNAFTPTMVNEINHVFAKANVDEDIRVVIIRAEGPVFCAGMDLKTFEDPNLDISNPAIENKDISLGEVFERLLKPSIAVVEGDVIAGGFMMILGCTYVFCKKEVRFRLPELALGIFPFQVVASLLKVMSEKKALQLCLHTVYFSADKAKELGIVDDFIDDISLDHYIDLFRNVSEKAIKEGIKALRTLKTIPQDEQFSYLKNRLDALKHI